MRIYTIKWTEPRLLQILLPEGKIIYEATVFQGLDLYLRQYDRPG